MEEKNQELEKIYKELYLTIGNDEKVIDYEYLVRMYVLYLSLFFNKNSDFYYDCQFLFYVVDGFKYFNDLFFAEDDTTEEIIDEAMMKHEMTLREKVNEAIENDSLDGTYSESDLIFCYTLELLDLFQVMGLMDEYGDKLRKLFFNTYLVEEKMTEKVKGCEGNEMEYWKHYN